MAIKSTVELEVKSNVKGFKGELRQLTLEAQNAVKEFGAFSPEAVKAEKRVAELRDRIEDFNDRVKAVNPDKFAQVQTVVQGVARGFQAAQGAIALFGNESKDLEKTLIKLQGAMALADGLEGLGKIQQQFTAIFSSVVDGAKKAFAAIKAGIGSTGIGLLVIALGSIVAYWDEIKYAIMGVSEETKKAKAEQDKYNKSIKELNREREILLYGELAGKKSELLDIESETNRLYEQQAKIQERLKVIAQSRALAGVGHGKEEEARLRTAFNNAQLRLEQLTNDEIRTRNAITKIEEQDQAKKKALADKLEEDRKTAEEKRLREVKSEKERENAMILELYGIRTKKLYQAQKLNEEDVKKRITSQATLEELSYQKQYSNQEKLTLFAKVNHSELVASTIGYFNTISELADAFASKDEESQRRAFAISKAMRYASTVLSTIEGVQNSFTTAADSPITKVFPAYPFVQASAAALFGVAQLAKIQKTKFNSTSAPSQSSGAGVPQMGAPRTTSSTLQNGGNNLTNQNRVYVTEGDITRTQNRVNDLQKVSVVK
jgi:chromosome segregation ATPase